MSNFWVVVSTSRVVCVCVCLCVCACVCMSVAILAQVSGGCACRDMMESEQAASGAPERVVAQAGSDASTMTLEGAIAKLTLHSDLDDGGMAILAAATTLRESPGRGRQSTLYKMCRDWDVDRREKDRWQVEEPRFARP